MSEKRKHDDTSASSHSPASKKHKHKHGFRVGPQNLPDGSYRRKTQKIKGTLIERARIKKDYEKLKRQHRRATSVEAVTDAPDNPDTTPHPDRQVLMENEEINGQAFVDEKTETKSTRQRRPPKAQPFKREREQALKRRAEAEEQQRAREDAQQQRKQKLEERDRFRKAMAKARTAGPNGQRKLGRESKILLSRVKRMVGEEG